MPESITAGYIAHQLGLKLMGDPEVSLQGVHSLKDAQPGNMSFLYQPAYLPYLETTRASAVILKQEHAAQCPVTCLIADDPYLAYAQAAQILFPSKCGIGSKHDTAVVGSNCTIGKSVGLGAHSCVGDNVVIDDGALIGEGCVVGDNAVIGAFSELKPNSVLMEDTRIGDRCIIHSGAVIGSDGFGFANNRGRWEKIPQVGAVIIGSDVEVGANTTIDRGAVGDTVIQDGVKLDNQIHIAHNVEIGEHTIMAGGVKIAGSTTIGKYCLLGGNVSIVGHVNIADKVTVTALSFVTKSLEKQGSYSSGFPAEPSSKWRRLVSRFRHLEDLGRRIKEVEKKLEGV